MAKHTGDWADCVTCEQEREAELDAPTPIGWTRDGFNEAQRFKHNKAIARMERDIARTLKRRA